MRSTLATDVPPNFITRRDKRTSDLSGEAARLAQGVAAPYKGGAPAGQRSRTRQRTVSTSSSRPHPLRASLSAKSRASTRSASRGGTRTGRWRRLHRLTPVRVGLGARRRRPPFRPRGRGRSAARGPEGPRRRLRRGPVRRAARPARRRRFGDRPGRGLDRGRAPPRRGDRREARLSRRDRRGAGRRGSAVRRRRAMEVVEHVAEPGRFVAEAASLIGPAGCSSPRPSTGP